MAWIDHMLHTPMDRLAWWELVIALGFIAGLFAGTAVVFSQLDGYLDRRRTRKAQQRAIDRHGSMW